MGEFDIRSQLELYSNAIVGFAVIQGLGFLYHFGTNQQFKELVQAEPDLSVALIVVFLIVMTASLYCNQKISRALQIRASAGDAKLIKQVFQGKAVAIIVFCSMQVYFVLVYGLLKYYKTLIIPK